PLFDETIERIAPAAPLMVGDRLDTDISGARSAGIPSLFVLTGVNSLTDVLNAIVDERPDYVGHDLAALHEPHPAVSVDGDRATCGSATVEIRGGSIAVTSAGQPTETLRAIVGLGW